MSDHVPPPAQGPYGPPPAQGPYGPPPAQGPYGPPPAQGPYGPPPAEGPYHPQPAQGPYSPPYGAPPGHAYAAPPGHPYGAPTGHPYTAAPPLLTMPTTVRAAQITIWAMTGLTVLASILVGLADGARGSGASAGQNLLGYVLFVLAFRYGKAGNGVRITSIVLASLQIPLALSGTFRGILGGIVALVGAIVVVVLLSQGDTGRWFKRPRSQGFTA